MAVLQYPAAMIPCELLLSRIAAANAARASGDAAGGEAGRALEREFHCSQWLAVYGTLAVGEVNHGELAGCRGSWQAGRVRGRRGLRQYPVFRFDPEATEVVMQILQSADLPRHWPPLDEFEGPEYQRVLVPVLLASGWQVANLYESIAPID
jgi:gamma-glutamylcyclotransferase (GGCT)/AIG2-like uncharacterized protein YtfP